MSHPYMTEELVAQRRAALHAEASQARLAGQLRPRTRGDPDRPRFLQRNRVGRDDKLPGLVDASPKS